MIEFRVFGIPAPQSGTRIVPTKAGPRGVSTGGRDLLPWRQAVASAAAVAMARHGVLDGPLNLDVEFRFPMPKSRPKYIRLRGFIPKATTPDVDKLLRALGDSLQAGGLVHSDAQLADVRARKVEVWEDWTGALIRVGPVAWPSPQSRHPAAAREMLDGPTLELTVVP